MMDRPAPRNASTGRAYELIHAGTTLKITPVSIDTPSANNSTAPVLMSLRNAGNMVLLL